MAKRKDVGVIFPAEMDVPGLMHPASYDSEKYRKFITAQAEEDAKRLNELCRHYEIESGPWMYYMLALELARELYPVPKKRGRKSKWTEYVKAVLVVEVERLTVPNDLTHGVAWACNQLAKREPWLTFIEAKEESDFGPDPGETLRQTYMKSRDSIWAKISRDAFKYHEWEGTVQEWEQSVLEVVNKHF